MQENRYNNRDGDTQQPEQTREPDDSAALVDLSRLIGDSINVAGEHLVSRMPELGVTDDDEAFSTSNQFLSAIMPAIILRSNILYDYIRKCILDRSRRRQQSEGTILARQKHQEDQIASETRRLAAVKDTTAVLDKLRVQTEILLTRLKQLCDSIPSDLHETIRETMKIAQDVEADVEQNMNILSYFNIAMTQQYKTPMPGPSNAATVGVTPSASSSKEALPRTLDAARIFAEMKRPGDPEDDTVKLCTHLLG